MEELTDNSQFNWQNLLSELGAAHPSFETDNKIDLLIQQRQANLSQEAIPSLLKALELTEDVFIKQRIVFAIVSITSDEDSDTVDRLVDFIQENSQDDFLYSQLIRALGILAQRNYFAYVEVLRIFLKIKSNNSRCLLVQSARVIGILEQIKQNEKLRKKLIEWQGSEDLAVKSEVFYQQGILTLADSLLSENIDNLQENLKQARLMFLYSKQSEESREDAEAFVLLLNLISEFFNLTTDSTTDNRNIVKNNIKSYQISLVQLVTNPHFQSWYGFRSFSEQLLLVRILTISDLFTKIVESLSKVDEWTNFDEVLVELASICILLQKQSDLELKQLDDAFSEIAPRIVLPKLGDFILKAVGRVRFNKVIENYIKVKTEDDISQILNNIYEKALSNNYEFEQDINKSILINEARKAGETPDFFLTSLLTALQSGDTEDWLKKHHYPNPPLAIDNPDLYGNDPSIDISVRKLLAEIRSQLQEYPQRQWLCLIKVCVSITKFVSDIRDNLPDYTLRSPDGKGQTATEQDLQNDLFQYLRRCYGRSAEYEFRPIAGGRCDTGLKFSECEFPIECKAEWKNISPEHIHKNYIAQVDTYASVRDGVAFLMILDLRDTNSGVIPKEDKQKNMTNIIDERCSLYHLKDSFWVDGLPADIQLPHRQKNAVIVGLVPGNRPTHIPYEQGEQRK